MRVKILKVSSDLIVDFLSPLIAKWGHKVKDPLPADARIVGVGTGDWLAGGGAGTVLVKIESEHWPDVAHDEAAPFVDPVPTIVHESPDKMAAEWYKPEQTLEALRRDGNLPPDETDSEEFAEWLTKHLRQAMAKGIQIGRG